MGGERSVAGGGGERGKEKRERNFSPPQTKFHSPVCPCTAASPGGSHAWEGAGAAGGTGPTPDRDPCTHRRGGVRGSRLWAAPMAGLAAAAPPVPARPSPRAGGREGGGSAGLGSGGPWVPSAPAGTAGGAPRGAERGSRQSPGRRGAGTVGIRDPWNRSGWEKRSQTIEPCPQVPHAHVF